MQTHLNRRNFLFASAGSMAILGLMRVTPVLSAETTTLKTANGTLRGSRSNGVLAFRGVPYADTTAGGNRFMAPQPVKPWQDERDAETLGSMCPQVKSTMGKDDPVFEWYFQDEAMGEDCLVLNVYTPGAEGKRPVFFYIHGGGYINGGGGGTGLDGSPLARYADAVVITINHRLNAFGYSSFDAEGFEDAANAGHLDIIAALRWVRDNVKDFGGDPENVTIFGQSGGGSKIMSLLAMPGAKGLFHRAVSMSGAAGLSVDAKESMKPYADALLAELGVSNPAEAQNIPFETVLEARTRAVKASGLEGARPVVDGRHIFHQTMSPEGMQIHADVPLIFGHTEEEATLFFRSDMRNFSLTEDQMRRRLAKAYAIDEAKINNIVKAYRAVAPEMTASDILVAVASDVQFRLPLTRAAEQRSAVAGQAPVWLYDFGWSIPASGGVLGAPHAVDIPFAFGTMQAAGGMIGTGDSGPETSLNMMSALSAFAQNGNPNNDRMPQWDAVTPQSVVTMRIDRTCQAFIDWRGEALESVSDLKIDPFNRASLYIYED